MNHAYRNIDITHDAINHKSNKEVFPCGKQIYYRTLDEWYGIPVHYIASIQCGFRRKTKQTFGHTDTLFDGRRIAVDDNTRATADSKQ